MKTIFALILCLALAAPAAAAEESRPAEYAPAEMPEVYFGEAPPAPAVGEQDVPDSRPDASGPAGAREAVPFANAGELYESWYANSKGDELSVYPEGVCGVWSTDGTMDRLTIAVTPDEAGEACKEAILAQVEDDSTLTFTHQTYTYRQLRQLQEELTAYLGDETGACSIGVHEMENRVVIGIDTAHPGARAFMDRCAGQYGDMVGFEGGKGYHFSTALGQEAAAGGGQAAGGPETSRAAWLWLLCTAGVLAAALVIRPRGRSAVLARVDGGTQTAAPLTRKQTAQAVREAALTPDRRAWAEILKCLE